MFILKKGERYELKGICVDDSYSVNLKKGEIYYLFPCGKFAYYASRFNDRDAHFGAYQKNRFQLLEKLDNQSFVAGERYKAYLWKDGLLSPKGYYYLEIKKSGVSTYFYEDPNFEKFIGCYSLSYFKDFEKIDFNETKNVEEPKQPSKSKQLSKPKQSSKPKQQFEQLSLFDF